MAPFFGTDNHPLQTLGYNSSVYGGPSAELLTKAFSLDGVDESIRNTNTSANGLGGSGNDCSFGCWFKRGAAGAPDYTMFSRANAFRNYDVTMIGTTNGTGGEIRVIVDGNTSATLRKNYITPLATYDDDAWHHIAVTWAADGTSGTLKVYIDAVEITMTKSRDDAMPYLESGGSADFRVGHLSGSQFYGGSLAGVFGFQGVELSAGEVSELYGGGTSGAIRPSGHSQAASLLFGYDGMEVGDDMTGTTGNIANSGTSGFDGQPINTESGDLVTFP